MSLPLIIYLITMADALKVVAAVLTFLSAAALSIAWANKLVEEDSMYPNQKSIAALSKILKFGWTFPVLLVLAILTPSSQTGYTMLAAYGVQSAVDSPRVQGIAEQSLAFIEKTIGEQLNKKEAK